MVPTEAEEVSQDQLIKGLEYQDKDLDLTLGDGEPWEVYEQGSGLFALRGAAGVAHIHSHALGALPLSATFIFFSGTGTGGFNELITHSTVR